MSDFAIHLLPLYVTIFIGFGCGRWLKVERESIGKIVFYVLAPLVMFGGVLRAEATAATFSLPFVGFFFAAILNVVFLKLSRLKWDDAHANILACGAGTGNTGYFGLPLAIALFDEATVAAYILFMLGISICESSVGFFIAACGKSTVRESLIKLARLPLLYAFALGVFLRVVHASPPEIFWEFIGNIRGAYTVLGMMIVGLGLSGLQRLRIDWGYLSISFVAKFVAWPLMMAGVVWLDTVYFGVYPAQIHQAMMLISLVPLAANTVVIATILQTEPQKVATAVFLSYVLAVFYVPAMVGWLVMP